MRRRVNLNITRKITLLVIFSVLFSVLSLVVIGYKVNFRQIDEAAGLELIGCASITSGLVNPQEIEMLKSGNNQQLDKVQKEIDWIVDHKPIFKNAMIMTTGGKLLAVDKRLAAEGFKAGDTFYVDQQAMQSLKEHGHAAYSEIYRFGQAERKTGYAPIFQDHDPSKPIVAVMAIDFDSSIIAERTWTMLKFTLQSGAIFPILAAFVAYLAVRRMVRPLILMNLRAKEIAEGDLSGAELAIVSRDEIGQLSQSFNRMTDSLRHIVGIVGRSSDHMAESSSRTADSTEQVNAATYEVTKNIESLALDAEKGSQSVKQASEALHELSSLIRTAEAKAGTAKISSEVTMESAVQGRQVMSDAAAKMENIRAATIETEQLMASLEQYSKGIANITGSISEISSQTHLLALNASIEAAQAGEAGRGFTVVANEVKKLADQTRKEAGHVEALIRKITEATEQTVSAAERTRREAEEGFRVMNIADQALEKIVHAVDQTAAEVRGIAHITNEEVAASAQIVAMVQTLSAIIEMTAASAEELSASSEETAATMQTITHGTEQLKALADEMKSNVEVFKVI